MNWRGLGSSKPWTFKSSMKAGWSNSFQGAGVIALPLAFASAGMAPRGRKASTLASGLSMGAGAFLGAALLSPVMPAIAAAVVGSYLIDEAVGGTVGRGVQYFRDYDRNSRRLRMGGSYQDTEVAYTMRQQAVQEMSGSLLNARKYLGSEGILMHS